MSFVNLETKFILRKNPIWSDTGGLEGGQWLKNMEWVIHVENGKEVGVGEGWVTP